MRLTADILLRADNYINPYKDREINLRGLKIPLIENVAVLQDQFDVLDLSDNEIKKLDGFPPMKRLNCLLLNNNTITKIGNDSVTRKEQSLSNLTSLILTNNRISSLSEIVNLANCYGAKLEVLSLIDNTVVLSSNYRLFTIFKLPSLKSLDYKKVTKTEREAAKKYFEGAAGKNMLSVVEADQKAKADGVYTGVGKQALQPTALTKEQKEQVKKAIDAATTKEQIDFIEKQLKSGNFDFFGTVSIEADETAGPKQDEEATPSSSSSSLVTMQVSEVVSGEAEVPPPAVTNNESDEVKMVKPAIEVEGTILNDVKVAAEVEVEVETGKVVEPIETVVETANGAKSPAKPATKKTPMKAKKETAKEKKARGAAEKVEAEEEKAAEAEEDVSSAVEEAVEPDAIPVETVKSPAKSVTKKVPSKAKETAKEKKAREAAEKAEAEEVVEEVEEAAPATKKRGRQTKVEAVDEAPSKPAPKKRGRK